MAKIPYKNKKIDPLLKKTYRFQKNGAGDGNRTRMTSLEGWSSAIELHLHNNGRDCRIRTCDPLVPNQMLYQAELSPENDIYLILLWHAREDSNPQPLDP